MSLLWVTRTLSCMTISLLFACQQSCKIPQHPTAELIQQRRQISLRVVMLFLLISKTSLQRATLCIHQKQPLQDMPCASANTDAYIDHVVEEVLEDGIANSW